MSEPINDKYDKNNVHAFGRIKMLERFGWTSTITTNYEKQTWVKGHFTLCDKVPCRHPQCGHLVVWVGFAEPGASILPIEFILGEITQATITKGESFNRFLNKEKLYRCINGCGGDIFLSNRNKGMPPVSKPEDFDTKVLSFNKIEIIDGN